MPRFLISIITATYNSEKDLPSLVRSLELQSDSDFEWVVKDGGSTDATRQIFDVATLKNKKFVSNKDFGIYDALNEGIQEAAGRYYLVAGSDDLFDENAVRNYKRSIVENNEPDFVAASVDAFGRIIKPGKGAEWKIGGNAYVASHAVGVAIKADLHQNFGFYSNKYPNCADMAFILKVLKKPGSRIAYGDFLAGFFATDGLSSKERFTSLTDAYRIQIEMGANKIVQLILLSYRLLRLSLKSS